MSDNNYMTKMQFFIPKYHEEKIRAISALKKIPMSRIISFAIDNEIMRSEGKPFNFPVDLPEDYVEFAYADEAGKLLKFMKTINNGIGLDMIVLFRFEIGVPDKVALLAAFKECLDKKLIEAFKAKPRPGVPPLPDDYFHYRVTGTSPKDKKRVHKKGTKYERYLKLKKEFEKS